MKQYIISALRSIRSNRSFSLINIANLVVGFTSFILIAFWIKYELSYDNFHPYAERTFRIAYEGMSINEEIKDATTAKVINEVLTKEFPEVEIATITMNFDKAMLAKDDGTAFMVGLSGVNPNIFDVFDIPVIEGDVDDLLKPNTAFITQEMATIYFGDGNPVGEAISTGMDREYKRFTIVGIIGSLPENSHFDYDMLYSNASQSWYNRNNSNWLNTGFHNYVVLKPGTDLLTFEEKFNKLAIENIAPIIKSWQNISLDEWFSKGNSVKFVFHPLQSIHLTPSFENEYKQNGSMVYIYIFLIVGLLILIISVINFSNLSTVKSISRSKEIGVRKTFGSNRRALIIQFLLESILLSVVALIVSFALIGVVAPYYQDFTGIQIWSITNVEWWGYLILLAIAIISGVLAGSFPAFFISKQSPVDALLFTKNIKLRGVLFKDLLVVTQFIISLLVIIGAFVVTNQLNFLQNTKLGFKKDNILIIKGTENISWDKTILMNKELKKMQGVKQSSSSHFIPNKDCDFRTYNIENDKGVERVIIDILPCDYNYINVYRFELLEGRFFNEAFLSDARKIVINEKAAQTLNVDDCIGKKLERQGVEYEIIGVVKDFHYSSKHSEISPMGMVQMPDVNMFWNPLFCSVLLEGDNTLKTLGEIEELWNKISPGTEFTFSFFDDDYDYIYRQEMQTRTLFIIFSIIAISLSCFGLFGFVKYLVQSRTKEIGIRKVNGASNISIFLLLSKYFTRPIVVAIIFAFPIAWYSVNEWLKSFAYRIDIEFSYFLLAGLFTIVIVFLTVGFIALKAARRNPVDSLRYE
jgi:putative ABC transport system permease protein